MKSRFKLDVSKSLEFKFMGRAEGSYRGFNYDYDLYYSFLIDRWIGKRYNIYNRFTITTEINSESLENHASTLSSHLTEEGVLSKIIINFKNNMKNKCPCKCTY